MLGLIGWVAAAAGAELYARKMAIVRTPEGPATVFRDSVTISDSSTRLTSHSCRMDRARGIAVMNDSVHIESPDARVWADSAVYHLNEKRAELFGRVKVLQDSLAISAPRLVYATQDRQVRAEQGVVLENLDRSWRLTGQRGSYSLDSGVGVVDSLPVLTQMRAEAGTKESVRVTSRRMLWFERGSRAEAHGAIQVSSGASKLCCDTAVFFAAADSGVAWGGKPLVRDSAGEVSGDTMIFLVRNGALDRVAVRRHAHGQYQTSSREKVIVQGEVIQLWLTQGDIDRIEVAHLTLGQLVRNQSQAAAGSTSQAK